MAKNSVGRARAAAWVAAPVECRPADSPSCATAQEAKSADLVKQLTQVLDAEKTGQHRRRRSAVAGNLRRGAVLFGQPVVDGLGQVFAAPTLLVDKIAKKDYREVYIDLSSASVAGSKLFVIDTNADGLNPKPGDDQPFDTAERGNAQYSFDGNWKKAKMTEADYMKAFAEVDGAYAHALTLLTAQAKVGS